MDTGQQVVEAVFECTAGLVDEELPPSFGDYAASEDSH
jgi:hypothetical protein